MGHFEQLNSTFQCFMWTIRIVFPPTTYFTFFSVIFSALSSGNSFLISVILTVLTFSGMQMYKQWLSSSQLNTIIGGLLGSLFFVFCLTGLSNLESSVFGKNFQTKLFPEGMKKEMLEIIIYIHVPTYLKKEERKKWSSFKNGRCDTAQIIYYQMELYFF